MAYFKIPISNGVFDYPAGSILCCAYTYSGYMYCKFERVVSVGTDWEIITESEFDIRCPEVLTPSIPPVQDVVTTSAALTDGNIVLDVTVPVGTGTLVKFKAPCACSSVTGGIVIDGTTYTVVNAIGAAVASTDGLWASGAQIAVLLDASTKKAYIQNEAALRTSGGTMTGAINMGGKQITNMAAPTENAHAATKQYVDTADKANATATSNAASAAAAAQATANAALPKAGGTMTGRLTVKGLSLTANTDYGTTLPAAGTKGRIFFKVVSE